MKKIYFLRVLALCLALTAVLTFSACSGEGGGEEAPSEEQTQVYIVKTELINGKLIVTYSDGRVENFGTVYDESDSDSLSFYPLPDGTYGITAGNTIYLEGITIPETYKGKAVSTILNDAFKGNENLKTVTIPKSIVNIGASAFFGCKNLKEANLPDGLLDIGASAFSGCEKLSAVVIPETVKTIGAQAFYMCTGVEGITLPDKDISIGGSAFFGTAYCDNAENRDAGALFIGKHLIDLRDANVTDYTVKDDTLTVANFAFSTCTALKSVNIPDSVMSLGNSAFAGCRALEAVNWSENTALCRIGEGAFSGCTALKSVSLPRGVDTVEKETFKDCTALTSVTLGSTDSQLKVIGEKSFSGCTALAEITLPGSVEEIKASAFSGCTALEEVEISAEEGNEGNEAKLKVIGDEAFAGCEKMARITLPLSLCEIGKRAFADCTALAEINYPDTEKEWKKNVQKGTDWNENTPEDNMKFKEEEKPAN